MLRNVLIKIFFILKSILSINKCKQDYYNYVYICLTLAFLSSLSNTKYTVSLLDSLIWDLVCSHSSAYSTTYHKVLEHKLTFSELVLEKNLESAIKSFM